CPAGHWRPVGSTPPSRPVCPSSRRLDSRSRSHLRKAEVNLAAPASSGAAQLHLPRSLVLSRHPHHSCYLNLYTLDAIPHRARLLMAASESVWAFVAKENGDDGVIVKGAEPPTSAAEHVQARCARV